MYPPNFVLQFDPSEISRLAARYGYKQDKEAFEAGISIASGNYTRQNLEVIVRWKSPAESVSLSIIRMRRSPRLFDSPVMTARVRGWLLKLWTDCTA